jgi:hypothetical protein
LASSPFLLFVVTLAYFMATVVFPNRVMPGTPAADVRPDIGELATTLAAFDLPVDGELEQLTFPRLRTTLYQWIAVLEASDSGELAGLTDDLRTLAAALADHTDDALLSLSRNTTLAAALHRAGLSLERVAAWGRLAGRTPDLLAFGQRLIALSEGLR